MQLPLLNPQHLRSLNLQAFLHEFMPKLQEVIRSWQCWFLCLVLLIIGFAFGVREYRLQHNLKTTLTTTLHMAELAALKTQPQVVARTDFTSELPAQPVTNVLIQDGFKIGKATGVSVLSAQPASEGQADGQLSRVTINFKVRGAYPAIKQLLAELLLKYPGLTLRHLIIRRGSEGVSSLPTSPLTTAAAVTNVNPEQEAELVFVQWGRNTAKPADVGEILH